MSYISRFFLFWYDFIVGDAWEVALGVVVALILAGLVVRAQPTTASILGPLLALAVVVLLAGSIWAEAQKG